MRGNADEEAGVQPLMRALDQAMPDRFVMNIVKITRQFGFATQGMFPELTLPHIALLMLATRR